MASDAAVSSCYPTSNHNDKIQSSSRLQASEVAKFRRRENNAAKTFPLGRLCRRPPPLQPHVASFSALLKARQ